MDPLIEIVALVPVYGDGLDGTMAFMDTLNLILTTRFDQDPFFYYARPRQ
jgi:hypothetical protein